MANDTKAADNREVQQQVDQELDQGYVGRAVDPTPNENYTVSGVTSGAPTPETDESQAAKAREAQVDLARNPGA